MDEQRPIQNRFNVVGIGASAGGLASIESICRTLDEAKCSQQCIYVFVQHLPPDKPSYMQQILARQTNLPVVLIENGMVAQPGRIYLSPPDLIVSFRGFSFELSPRHGHVRPDSIDHLFNSIAKNFHEKATGVVLSGTGSDGSAGLSEIHLNGGVTIAESPETAGFDGMPNAAIATGMVDYVLKPEEMAAYFVNNQNPSTDRESTSPAIAAVNDAYDELIDLLSERYDLSLSSYKPSTIFRRISRRSLLEGYSNIHDYLEAVRHSSEKLQTLYRDVLIGVTQFFRDTQVFENLRSVIRSSLDKHPSDQEFRVWVAGCSTGEEAYSIGMLVLEEMEAMDLSPQFKVLASDTCKESLASAAFGEFEAKKLADIDEPMRQKYFRKQDNGNFRVESKFRQHFLFSRHDLILHSPFTRIDLATCRNLLIYLNTSTQNQCLNSLHFSLKENGVLLLGSSETLGDLNSEFETIDSKNRIFRKLKRSRPIPVDLRTVAETALARRKQSAGEMVDKVKELETRSIDNYAVHVRQKCQLGLILDLDRKIIEVFGSEHLLFASNGNSNSHPSIDSLNTALAQKLEDAFALTSSKTNSLWIEKSVQTKPECSETYRVTAWSVTGPNKLPIGWFVDFELETEVPEISDEEFESQQRLWQLQSELEFSHANLGTMVQKLATSYEELQSANEEMVASNEELQSTNEELQSVNEELHTVNEAHSRKIRELQEVSEDLDRLLTVSDIGSILLDPQLQILRFTTSVKRHFNLLSSDIGRSLLHFTNRLGVADLYKLMQEAVTTGSPYSTRTLDEFGEGVFIKLVPLEENGNIEALLLNIIHQSYSDADEPITMTYGEIGSWEWPSTREEKMWWSPTCYQMLGLNTGSLEPTFSNWKSLIHPEDRHKLAAVGQPLCQFASNGFIQLRMQLPTGQHETFDFRGTVRYSEQGEVLSMSGTISRSRMIQRFHARSNRAKHV